MTFLNNRRNKLQVQNILNSYVMAGIKIRMGIDIQNNISSTWLKSSGT